MKLAPKPLSNHLIFIQLEGKKKVGRGFSDHWYQGLLTLILAVTSVTQLKIDILHQCHNLKIQVVPEFSGLQPFTLR
jgi:hypothetical protein